ncbi:hypothetical protein AB1K54_14515 [Microbacterium sp. BWT-B31]|uniref:GH39 family glycosyl hydrolase n=1 Tax=Microbacterium sp. BWT-B31 TaxID=3232072 RepID=UPI0035282864
MNEVVLDVGAPDGTLVRALHGVNNGPVTYGGLVDASDLYREAQIPFVRLHDPNWPHAWEVDIHTIFPDFDRDPSDPDSYDFARTDDYIASIVATGASIVYRLGESIEHSRRKYFVHPPADAAKWAQVCLGIIRHYNEGWADGYAYGIAHWEIWNEADNPDIGVMWSGTDDEYFTLYAVTAKAIRAAFPEIRIGGPACTMINEAHTREFLRRCRDERLPLDFFSWHTYADKVSSIVDNARLVDGWLAEYGFDDVEIHLNEWNHIAEVDPAETDPVRVRRFLFDRVKGMEGASFAAGVLCALQDTSVTVANYYDGQPRGWYCGLFDDFGAALPTYGVFREFGRLSGLPRVRATFDGTTSGLYAIAAGRDTEIEMLIANPTADVVRCVITGLPSSAEYAARQLGEETGSPSLDNAGEMMLPAHSVVVLRPAPSPTTPSRIAKE